MVPKKIANRCQARSSTPVGAGRNQTMMTTRSVARPRSIRFPPEAGLWDVVAFKALDYSMGERSPLLARRGRRRDQEQGAKPPTRADGVVDQEFRKSEISKLHDSSIGNPKFRNRKLDCPTGCSCRILIYHPGLRPPCPRLTLSAGG